MTYYDIQIDPASTATDPLLHGTFRETAQNDQIIPSGLEALAALPLTGGKSIRFNGPCTVPLAMAIAHAVAHRYGYVACFDPKMQGYVVVISHHPDFRPGQLVD